MVCVRPIGCCCALACRDLGINVLDTASAYLLSEERIGKAAAARRGEYFLASKCGEYSNYAEQTTAYDFSYEAVSASIDNSLKLLQTDVIDLMQIHFGPDQQKVIDEDDEQGHNVIKSQFDNGFRDQLIRTFQMHGG